MPSDQPAAKRGHAARLLDLIEKIGNALPDPVFLFLGAALLVMVLSAVGAGLGWSVQPVKPIVAEGSAGLTLVPEGDPVAARSLLTSDGLYWALSNMVRNFINFAPLGVVLTSMLGIGLAERVGLFGAAMKWLATIVPSILLTPMVVFLGVMSSLASDAGYIVLPPLAAALYLAVGRPPVAGIAAAFAGVAAGFSANLLISAGDALLAELTTRAAHVIDPAYTVVATANWFFMIASTFLLTFIGWAVTAWVVEPRLRAKPAEDGGPRPVSSADLESQKLSAAERRALGWAGLSILAVLALVLALILIPGAPLHGQGLAPGARAETARWTQVIPPLILLFFITPGIVYGMITGSIRTQGDVAKCLIHAMGTMGPIIALAFFAAQFIEYLKYSNLDRMLAFVGGEALLSSGLPPSLLMVGVVIVTLVINMFIGSMSAKWTMLAPILVPMLMMVGLSPELTQVAYRVGDSATNIITPLNTYIIIVLVVMQRYARSAGIGTLIAMMVPYSVAFAVLWTLFLLAWVWLGIPLGPGAPLVYTPAAG